MDFISGDLDKVFTVLYEMGHVEPILKRDWKELYRESQIHWREVSEAIHKLNGLESIKEMRDYLVTLRAEVIDAIVVEVARELAHFQERGETLH